MIRTTQARRRGFTLVEILVAIALGIVLLGIAVGVSQSSAFESYKVVGSADRLSQWMLTAKNRALRDRSPRGVRLIPDANNLVREVAYIEQPDPWIPPLRAGGPAPKLIFQYALTETRDPATPAAPAALAANQKILFLGQASSGDRTGPRGNGWRAFIQIDSSAIATLADFQSLVQEQDMLHVPELNQSFRITARQAAGANTSNPTPTAPSGTIQIELVLADYPDFGAGYSKFAPSPATDGVPLQTMPTFQSSQFGFLRQARPLLGEPTQLLPSGMVVDLVNSSPAIAVPTSPAVPTPLDIMFSPSGAVINNSDGITALLVRDGNLPGVTAPLTTTYAQAGQMILVCLYGRTGAISTQPVNPPPATDSFQFAKDGLNTGL